MGDTNQSAQRIRVGGAEISESWVTRLIRMNYLFSFAWDIRLFEAQKFAFKRSHLVKQLPDFPPLKRHRLFVVCGELFVTKNTVAFRLAFRCLLRIPALTRRRSAAHPRWRERFDIARERLNGKDPTFDARFTVPGVGGNPEATGLLERTGYRNQSRLGSAR
jgi:hypothetical protein